MFIGQKLIVSLFLFAGMCVSAVAQDFSNRVAPASQERQLPYAMHSQMEELPQISVGISGADINGNDHRALQAAVEYIAALGGGEVLIQPGTYTMHDSLHLRDRVVIQGLQQSVTLKKAAASVSSLVLDGDFGEQQITVQDATGFDVGCGVAIWDDQAGGFHTTVARITGKRGNTFSIDKPLMADCMVKNNAQAATVFPVVSGYDVQGVRLAGLKIDGNKDANPYLNGCRGAGIFLYRGFGTVIENCFVVNYNGDGISFQQSNDVLVEHCRSEGNTQLGFHPGSGSQRPVVRQCIARNNGTDGLFLCWRVRHGLFEGNLLENNGRFGISIGHKDTDNLLENNKVYRNGEDGVFFRDESFGMAAHRNTLRGNEILDNGSNGTGAGIRIRGETDGLIFENNLIRDTRPTKDQTQRTGVLIEKTVGKVSLEDNQISAQKPVEDHRTVESTTQR